MNKQLTLCFITQGNRILLARKKRGWGEGLYNGYGGKLQDGETIVETAKRETQEEIGITAETLEQRGFLQFFFESKEGIFDVHVFAITSYIGTPVESEEMIPEWFDFEYIPYNKMWADDKYWLPIFLKGEKFLGKGSFDKNNNLTHFEMEKVEQL